MWPDRPAGPRSLTRFETGTLAMKVCIDQGVVGGSAIGLAAARAGHEVTDAEQADVVIAGERDANGVLSSVVANEVNAALIRGAARVVGAGLTPVLGVALARVAIGDRHDVSEVHITYSVPMKRRDWDPHTRTIVEALLAAPGREWHNGIARHPLVAEGRRLAWFPAPIGPHHAVSVPFADAVVLRRARSVDTATVSVAMRSWLAELVQVAGRGGRVGGPLRGRFARAAAAVTEERRAAQRWAVVVEVVTPTGVTRAWANGSDLLAAHSDVVVAMSEAAVDARGGLITAAEVDAQGLLDGLSNRGTLRWAVRRHDARPASPS